MHEIQEISQPGRRGSVDKLEEALCVEEVHEAYEAWGTAGLLDNRGVQVDLVAHSQGFYKPKDGVWMT